MTTVREAGFTIVEMAITVTVLVPLLYVALTTTNIVHKSVDTNDRVADANHALSRVTGQVYTLARPANASSVLARNDRAAAFATPLPADEYQGVQFRTDDPVEPITEIEFVRDAEEADDDVDNDGDGCIDEGSLQLRRGSGPWAAIATQVESTAFGFDGRTLTFTLACARKDLDGHVLRAQHQLRVCLRNN